MQYEKNKSDIILIQPDFNLDETLDCGQAFRWVRTDERTYSGYYVDRYLEITDIGNNTFILKNTSEDDFLNIWADYFDLQTDYDYLKKKFSQDKILSQACSFAGGIRLLRQDTWETLCSFIISQNNNIPRIKGIITRLCEKYNGFPTADMLACETVESLGFLRSGFRAKYILDAANKVADGVVDLDQLKHAELGQARNSLMSIKGVGPKVADCVLLFGMYRTEAFPVDVWIKRVMKCFFPDGMPECAYGYEGIAQQYLFHYARNNSGLLEQNT